MARLPVIFRNLGKFDPQHYDTDVIRGEWHSFLDQVGVTETLNFSNTDVRLPGVQWSALSDKEFLEKGGKLTGEMNTRKWHRDDWAGQYADVVSIMWASIAPTEVRRVGRSTTAPYQYGIGEAVMFDNLHHEHRQPMMDMEDAKNRIFIRTYAFQKSL